MWLCTQHGFYSIVRKAEDEFHIRARLRQDLQNLRDLVGSEHRAAARWKIHRSEPADYRWRMVVTRAEVALVFAVLALAIDYSNFKSRIHARPDQRAKLDAYHHLWGDLAVLQSTRSASDAR